MITFKRFTENYSKFFNGEDLEDRFDSKVGTKEFTIIKNEMALKSDVLFSRTMVNALNHRL